MFPSKLDSHQSIDGQTDLGFEYWCRMSFTFIHYCYLPDRSYHKIFCGPSSKLHGVMVTHRVKNLALYRGVGSNPATANRNRKWKNSLRETFVWDPFWGPGGSIMVS